MATHQPGQCWRYFFYAILALMATTPLAYSQTFFRTYGSSTVNEYGSAIVMAPNGNMVVGGSSGLDAMVAMFTPTGQPVWACSFPNAGVTRQKIASLAITPDGFIIGTGNTDQDASHSHRYDAFAFKMDVNGNVIWKKQEAHPNPVYFDKIVALNSSEYVVLACYESNGTYWVDVLMAKFDATNGNILSISSRFDIAPSYYLDDGSGLAAMPNGDLYVTGRIYVAGAAPSSMRPFIMKFDSNLNLQWVNYYMKNASASARLYGTHLIPSGNSLVGVAFGDLNSGGGNFETGLFKVDANGNLLWSHFYNITAYSDERSWGLTETSTGYCLVGRLSNNHIFVFHTDFNGVLQWAKEFTSPFLNLDYYCTAIAFAHNDIWFTVNSVAANTDLVLGRMSLAGTLTCGTVQTINPTTTTLPPFQMATSATATVDVLPMATMPNTVAFNLPDPCIATPGPNLGPDDTLCSGSIVLNGTTVGATAYVWQDGSTNPTLTVTTPGTYSVTITNNCCTKSDTIQILPGALSVALGNDILLCGGGTALFDAGPGGASYLWSTGQSSQTISVSLPGTYSVTVTDGMGCVGVDSVNFQNLPAPSLSISSSAAVSCFGGNDGTATANVVSGTPPTMIIWGTAPQQTGPTATGLPAGNYFVWAIDSFGCGDTIPFNITEPSPITVNVATVGVICNQTTGSATASVNGGSQPYFYLWSNNQTGSTATNLGAGNYSLTVTDGNGCQTTTLFTIQQLGANPVIALTAFNNITCFGGSDGSVTVSASGGVAPYTYLWSNGQGSSTATNLAAGTYTVTVTAQNGCQDQLTITLTEPTPMTGSVVTTPSGCDLSVPNGSAGVTISGAVPPYSYSWNTIPVQNGPAATGLVPGNYSVTVTDSRGCSLVLSASVGQIPSPTVTAGPDASFCEGEGGVQVLAVGTGGTPGYYYSWWCATPPCGLDSVNDNDSVANPSNSQWYYVQVTDTNGCTSNIDSLFVTVLPNPIVDAGPDIALCGDAAPCEILTPTITNAPGPYIYQWMPSTGLNDTTILNPCARPDTTTIYALVVTAGNGCASDYTTTDTLATVTVFVNPVPVADAGPDRDICLGDTTQLQGLATNAGPIYAFEWTPSHGLDDSTLANPLASPAFTTNYTLVVWSNGCPSYGDTVQVRVHTLPTVDAGWDREICPGQDTTLDATASGDSTASYTFYWWPGTGIVGSDSVEDVHVAPLQTTTYYVQATSSFGCGSHMDSATVYVRPAPLPDAGPDLGICPGDSIQLQASYYFTTQDSAPVSQIYFGWTPAATMSDSTALNPWVWPDVSTMYTLDIRYSICRYQDSVLVIVARRHWHRCFRTPP